MFPSKAKTANPPDVDSQGVPYGGNRIGECGDCGGHVMAQSGGHPVPMPPKCASCGAEVKQPLKMVAKKAGGKKGWLPKKRGNVAAAAESEYA